MLATDPIVRSIRVASALTERFGALMRKREKGLGIDEDQMAIDASEAEQIHPEIWSQLDASRDALEKRGLEVTAYDAIRAADRGTQWRINLAGFAKADQACRALMALLPDVDWVALDRADADEIAAAGSLRGGGWSRSAIVLFLGILALVGTVALVVVVWGFKTRSW